MDKGSVRRFEDLEVFRRAYRISLELHRAAVSFPKEERFGLALQIRRASKSIAANIAEGFGKQRLSKAEFNRFLMMAMGSADEMRVWLRYCLDLGYVPEERWAAWRDEYQEIARMLHGLIDAQHRNANPSDP
jgi:four helix bundle protein